MTHRGTGRRDVGIACTRLTKTYGEVRAVDDVTFQAPAGVITGFVGANGAGKTTTMRCLLGLARPTSGTAVIDGVSIRTLRNPRAQVGAVLDTPGAHPGVAGRAQLRIVAATCGVKNARIDEVLELTGLAHAARRRVGQYSLGMRQRLSIATALLTDPATLILDEPTKGLDPPGMLWLRTLLRSLADEGRCVFISSHDLSELETIADRVVMLDRGTLVADQPLTELLRGADRATLVRTPTPDQLREVLVDAGAIVTQEPGGWLRIAGRSPADVGDAAAGAGVALHGLMEESRDLEAIYQDLTATGGARS